MTWSLRGCEEEMGILQLLLASLTITMNGALVMEAFLF